MATKRPGGATTYHEAFAEGVASGSPGDRYSIGYNPAVSKAQQRYMGAALARKRAGHPRADDPDMSEKQLRDFARTKRKRQ